MKYLHTQSIFIGANGTAGIATLIIGIANDDPVHLLIAAFNAVAVAVNWYAARRLA
jgi:hypothetical protein